MQSSGIVMKIYSFFYKNGTIIKSDELYQPIMAGKALLSGTTDMPGDDTGDNISHKNNYFSELTGIYWVWKNTTNDIVGSCHYRRFLMAKPYPILHRLKHLLLATMRINKKKQGLIYTSNIKLFQDRIVNENEILEILKNHDAILPKSRKFRYSIEEHYHRYHNDTDLPMVREIINDLYPDYLDTFDRVLKDNELYANNMFIMKQSDFELFMQWWFDLLFEFENRAEMAQYTGYQERVIGFLAERLLTVWFKHQKMNIKELPVIYFRNLKKE